MCISINVRNVKTEKFEMKTNDHHICVTKIVTMEQLKRVPGESVSQSKFGNA